MLLGVTGAFAGSCLLTAGLRLSSILHASHLFQATGAEAPGMYGIYTIAAGRSLYVPMSQQPTAMLFNFLFYVFYGGATRIVLGSGLERFAVFVHLVTFAGTIVFAAVFGAYVMRRLTRCGWDEAPYLRAGLAVSVTSIVCLGPFLGWWYVAARPDAFAAGLEVAAIVLVLWGWRDRPTIGKVIVATCVFWLA
jgi:hypothetical protein